MAAGRVGVYGQAAASRAILGHKEDHGAARIHRLEMAGNLVQERRMNNACVTRTRVRVRKKDLTEEFFAEFSCCVKTAKQG